jgi:putative transposase
MRRKRAPHRTSAPGSLGSSSVNFVWRTRSASCRQREDLILLARIRTALAHFKETYGSPRMMCEFQDERVQIGRG